MFYIILHTIQVENFVESCEPTSFYGYVSGATNYSLYLTILPLPCHSYDDIIDAMDGTSCNKESQFLYHLLKESVKCLKISISQALAKVHCVSYKSMWRGTKIRMGAQGIQSTLNPMGIIFELGLTI